MSAATSTIIAGVAMGVSAGASAYAAKKGADASKQASQIQVDASNKAMDYQQQAQQQALAYLNNSRNAPMAPPGPAMTYLSKLMGVPGGINLNPKPSAPPPAYPGHQPAGPSTMQPPSVQNMSGAPPLGGLMGAPTGPTPSGGMVMLEAPTGERRAVPANQAQSYIARGAKQVN